MNVTRLASGGAPLPGWARATDFAAVLLAIMAVTISASGGMRVELWHRHVNLTSPIRILLWAAALVVVRHVIARDHPMYRHLAAQAAAWAHSMPLRTAALVTVGTRPAMFAAGYLAVVMFGYPAGTEPFHDFQSELLNLPLKWDAGWFSGSPHAATSTLPRPARPRSRTSSSSPRFRCWSGWSLDSAGTASPRTSSAARWSRSRRSRSRSHICTGSRPRS